MALASARNEISEQLENARLAAAKREALELLIVKIRNESELNLVEAKTLLSRETASKKWWIDLSNSLQAQSEFIKFDLSNSKNYALLKKKKTFHFGAKKACIIKHTNLSTSKSIK